MKIFSYFQWLQSFQFLLLLSKSSHLWKRPVRISKNEGFIFLSMEEFWAQEHKIPTESLRVNSWYQLMTSSVYCLQPHLQIQTYMIQYVFTLTAKAVLFLNILHLDLELEMRWSIFFLSFVFLFSFNTHKVLACVMMLGVIGLGRYV